MCNFTRKLKPPAASPPTAKGPPGQPASTPGTPPPGPNILLPPFFCPKIFLSKISHTATGASLRRILDNPGRETPELRCVKVPQAQKIPATEGYGRLRKVMERSFWGPSAPRPHLSVPRNQHQYT